MAVGLMGVAALVFSAPAVVPAEQSAAAAPSVVCGTERVSGLAVMADEAVPCSTALQVASAYTKVWKSAGDSGVLVRVGDATWRCQERQGDPNPYQRCVNTADSGQWVTLVS
ncbi:hypothetical protein SSP35_11_01530 [Streptomyces sp. NBRC 110611]|nr:hypothetical protein SSP35_11_01530 [Streptomyces sp. NBRC 110611]